MKKLLIHFFLMLVMVSGCSQSKRAVYPQYNPVKAVKTAEYHPLPDSLLQKKSSTARKPPMPCKEIKSIIVLDAGHGGDDYGTHSLGTPKFHEKYLNLSTAKIVQTFLQEFGHEVVMTRTDDTFIALEKRASLANARTPQLFVSIHYNSAPSREAEGIEVFYFRTDANKTRVAESKQLAQLVLDKTIYHTKARSRGVKHGNYAVLRETAMPAVLIEGGFLTNTGEMEKIKDATYLKKLALGIAQGIDSYLAKQKVLVVEK